MGLENTSAEQVRGNLEANFFVSGLTNTVCIQPGGELWWAKMYAHKKRFPINLSSIKQVGHFTFCGIQDGNIFNKLYITWNFLQYIINT